MFRIQRGIRETVDFEDGSAVKLYNNVDMEDFPSHWHAPIEIIMPLEKGYNALCGGTSYDLAEEDVLLIAPGTLHRLSAPAGGRRIIMQVELSVLRQLKEFDLIMSFLSPAICITRENAPEIHGEVVTLMRAIQDEFFGDSTLREAMICSLFIRMVVLIGRRFTEPAKNSPGANINRKYIEKFLDVCDHINQHFSENLSLEEVASFAGFSKFYFTQLFKQFTGDSFYKYLNKRRIAYAEQLLIDPELSITEVAIRSGFNNLSSFIRMFKLMKNCTPTEFRAMYHSTEYLL